MALHGAATGTSWPAPSAQVSSLVVDDVAEEEEDIEVIYGDMDDMDNMKDGKVSRLGPFEPQFSVS